MAGPGVRWAGRAAALLLSAWLLVGTAHAKAAPLVPGAQYDGHQGNTFTDLRVARSGKRLTGFSFGFNSGRCSDGGRYSSSGGARIPRGASINPLGHASYSHTWLQAWSFTRHGRRVNGHEQVRVTVQFAGAQVSGTLHDRFWSPTLRCSSGPVAFVAYQDGTPNAPVRSSTVATGSYRGRLAGSARQPVSLQVFLPWAHVMILHLHWKLRCGSRSFPQSWTFFFLPIVAFGGVTGFQFSKSGKGTRGGIRDVWSYRLYGTFMNPGHYEVSGGWRFTVRYYRRGSYLGSCGERAGFLAKGPSG